MTVSVYYNVEFVQVFECIETHQFEVDVRVRSFVTLERVFDQCERNPGGAWW